MCDDKNKENKVRTATAEKKFAIISVNTTWGDNV
jgi:hypothetical protein